MKNHRSEKITALLEKGVCILAPESIEIGNEVDIDRISGENTRIYAGSRIFGESTFIAAGAEIGAEGPATVVDCQIGPSVCLGGGFFKKSVFLNRSVAGANTHAREGTILEEAASLGHAVGVKQTILFPFVTLGSLINFCDCLMAGGTGPKNHSEVGSAYIHFNFSPHQDKATPSLFGDVPHGVMLRQQPIFLGGQGGATGPLRLTYGTVTAAGTICRKDEITPGRLLVGKTFKESSLPYPTGTYVNINRIVANNINYIANLAALLRWYEQVRPLFVDHEIFPEALLSGLKKNLGRAVAERIRRLEELSGRVPRAGGDNQEGNSSGGGRLSRKEELAAQKDEICEALQRMCETEEGDEAPRNRFLEAVSAALKNYGKNYLTVICSLDDRRVEEGTAWLQSVVDNIVNEAAGILPSFHLSEENRKK